MSCGMSAAPDHVCCASCTCARTGGCGELWAAAVVTTGTSASLMGCLIEGNSIGLWLSPSGQAWVENCLFCRNAYGCLWSGEGARNETAPRPNETAPAPAAALDPDSAPQEPSHRQQHPPTRGVKSRRGSRSRGDRGHVTLNFVQNTIHGRLWVSTCPLSFPPHLLPPPCSDLQSLAHDLALFAPRILSPVSFVCL